MTGLALLEVLQVLDQSCWDDNESGTYIDEVVLKFILVLIPLLIDFLLVRQTSMNSTINNISRTSG